MTSLSARRIVSACAISGACMAAVVAPGVANATGGTFKTLTNQCEGTEIHGQGSSAQKIIQIEHWNLEFSNAANTNAAACSGTQGSKSKVGIKEYSSTGSGAGLESWGVENTKLPSKINFGPENAYVGTEIAPNVQQEKEILSQGPSGAEVETIPVAQPAIAIVFHLPAGCTSVTGGPEPGRIALTQQLLQEIFRGKTIKKWSTLSKDAGFSLVPSKKEGCDTKAPLTRVVREDGSGTTDSFKKYLNQIEPNPVYSAKKDGETATWAQNGEKSANTKWPEEAKHPVLRGNGGGGVVKKVAENSGTVGYANLADARKEAAFDTVGVDEWAFVANNEAGTSFAEPSTNGEIATKGNSNCSETVYTNGKKAFPPASTTETWNEVTVSRSSNTYIPCYITYDLALTKYKGFDKAAGSEEPKESEARTVRDYIAYELNTEAGGGQLKALGVDYLSDPLGKVLTEAQAGVEEVGFE